MIDKENMYKFMLSGLRIVYPMADALSDSLSQMQDCIANISVHVDGCYEVLDFDYTGDSYHTISPGHYSLPLKGDIAHRFYQQGFFLGDDSRVDSKVAALLLLAHKPSLDKQNEGL